MSVLLLPVLLLALLGSCDLKIRVVSGADTLLEGGVISVSDSLVSAGEVFELGFFSPGNSSDYYVGIWYKQMPVQTVVWIGNRNFPVPITSVLGIRGAGNLVISYEQVIFSISNVTSNANTAATLMDSGNLVMKDSDSKVVWQSFDSPTDTLLPGMKLGINLRTGRPWFLQAWRGSDDPGLGAYSLKLDLDQPGQFSTWQGSKRYWTTGPWDGEKFSAIPGMRFNKIFNYSFVDNENESYLTYIPFKPNSTVRAVLDVSGQLKQLEWVEDTQQWNYYMGVPQPQCEIYAFCGPFGLCDSSTPDFCGCLSGFEPLSTANWRQGDRSAGCARRSQLQCGNSSVNTDKEDGFLRLSHVKYPRDPIQDEIGSAQECQSTCLRQCSCTAYAFDSSGRCLMWRGDLLNVDQLKAGNDSAETVFLKLAASEFPTSEKINLALVITPVVAVVVVLLFCVYFGRRLWSKRKPKGRNILHFDLDMESTKGDLSRVKPVDSRKNCDPGLPLFSFASVSAATNNFCSENKLGEGGFGPVFKGKLLNGMEIAVKRLSRRSGQGMEELQNEAMIIARLQHRNLVRLLGCCLEEEEKILIYEYMPNKSLDAFLFDPAKQGLLGWETRILIIDGIAQGLIYLHQYSRLRIIHRDLKASNVLLDEGMNPKISDFGMARIFCGTESGVNTSRIVGTYGYMPPEYALEGLFSVKSDVYSYGVLLLEILSGQKNTGFYHSDSVHLMGFVWDLWNKERALELVDPVFQDKCPQQKVMRYIKVGLLCVQELAADRPTMSEVLLMLTNDAVVIPPPKPPAFIPVRSPSASNPSMAVNNHVRYSDNGLTMSEVDGR
uniref:Receptor-like serine/threonine-protein kinase n=1 Tax=Kalanchoe fedtschenkoi TaxID=63787 RepID=A0A7N0ZQA2_KALFE